MEHLIDPDAKGPSRGEWGAWLVVCAESAVALGLIGSYFWLRQLPAAERDRVLPYAAPAWIAGFLAALVVPIAIRKRSRPDASPLTGATSRRELGLPYLVEIGAVSYWSGHGRWYLMIGDDAVDAFPIREMFLRKPAPKRIPLDDVRAVRSRGSKLVLHCEHDRNAVEVEITPCAYADRQRMLWELAVRVPDAVERGIDLDASKSAEAAPSARPTGSRATLPATGPARTGPAAAAPATLDARAAMSNFDAGMDGLGSALAAPASRPAAPPKSGLGCGLFVAEPKDDDDAPTGAPAAPR